MSFEQRTIFFHIEEYPFNYDSSEITYTDIDDLKQNLNTLELEIYKFLVESQYKKNVNTKMFSDINLSQKFNISLSTLRNTKVSLKKKGYVLIKKFKDETGQTCLRIIVGLWQVIAYNFGIKARYLDDSHLIDLFNLNLNSYEIEFLKTVKSNESSALANYRFNKECKLFDESLDINERQAIANELNPENH
jgi:hypothetical protein